METNRGIVSVDLVASAPKVDAEPVGLLRTRLPRPRKTAAEEKAAADKVEKDKIADLAAHAKTPNDQLVQYKAVKMKPLTGKMIKVSTTVPVVGNGDWRHIFFTYDGSGKAAGVKIYVDGVAVPTMIVADRLGKGTIRNSAPMQLGMRNPEAQPARDTRYQDLRLYARATTADETKRLPYEDYVAEITAKPSSQWDRDQAHVVGEFYFSTVDVQARATLGQIERSTRSLRSWLPVAIFRWCRASGRRSLMQTC